MNTASPLYLLLVGEYDDTEILGLTLATQQSDADLTARRMTRTREAANLAAADAGRSPAHSFDMVVVRAVQTSLIGPNGETL